MPVFKKCSAEQTSEEGAATRRSNGFRQGAELHGPCQVHCRRAAWKEIQQAKFKCPALRRKITASNQRSQSFIAIFYRRFALFQRVVRAITRECARSRKSAGVLIKTLVAYGRDSEQNRRCGVERSSQVLQLIRLELQLILVVQASGCTTRQIQNA